MAQNNFLQGVQVGSNIMGDAMNRDLRYQELKSQDALRRVQERAAAQEMELQLEKRNQQIQYQAEMAQGMSAAGIMSSPVVMTPMGPIPNPNPITEEQAIMRNILPVIGKYEPAKVVPIMENMALRRVQMEREQRMGQPPVARPLALETAELTKARTQTEIEKQNKLKADAARGPAGFAPTDVQKNLTALSEAEKKGDQNAIKALRQKLKLDGLGELDIIKLRSELRELDTQQLMSPEAKDKKRAEIYDKYDKIAVSRTKDSAPAAQPAMSADRRVKVRRPNGQTGTVPFSRLKDIPSDWASELDEK